MMPSHEAGDLIYCFYTVYISPAFFFTMFYAITAAINAITSVVLGFIVFLRDRKSNVNRMFSIFALSVAGWSAGYFFWQVSDNAPDALLWVRVFMAFAIFIPFFYFHFVLSFLGIEKKKRLQAVLGYATALFFVMSANTELFVAGVASKLTFPFYPEPGILFHPFLAVWIFYAIYPTVLLYEEFRKATGDRREQIKYMFWGMLVGYSGGVTNYFLWYGIPIPPVGNILVSAYVIIVAYAILKHHLFNMKVIATELIVFALWLFIFVRGLLAETPEDQLIAIGSLAAALFIGILLVRSVNHEVAMREKMESLAHDLERANDRLKELDQRKSEFVSLASHQLRSPLTAIKGYASMLLEGSFGKLDGNFRMPTERILESSNRLVAVVEDFLTISRIEQNRLSYSFQSVDLGKLVGAIVFDMKPMAEKKGLFLAFEGPPREGCAVTADSGKIAQIVTNLIDNALKYTPKGGVKVSLTKDAARRTCLLAVADTGIGMSAEAQKKVFSKFVRGDNAKAVNVTGAGIGLYIAEQLVAAHRGRIWGESEGEGKGSTFYLELPLEQ